MIYLVHGDDIAKSRALIANQQKKVGVEKRLEIQLEETEVELILEKSRSADLFGNFPFIVVDCTKASKAQIQQFADTLEKINAECTLIIYCNKELTKTNPILQKVATMNVKTALSVKPIEANIFKMVDTLYSKNRQGTYKELENLYKEDNDPLYILSMLVYGARNLAYLSFDSPSAAKMSPYIKSKANEQLKKFSQTEIKDIYAALYDLDKKAKSGALDSDLALTLAVEKVLNS